MKGTILCNKCRQKMTGSVCKCGNVNCYIALYWKGKHYAYRRNTQGEVYDYREALKAIVKLNSAIEEQKERFKPEERKGSNLKSGRTLW